MPVAYTRMRRRTAPPSNSYTGTCAACPLMSHSAVSSAEFARISAPPYPAWSDSRNMASQWRSTSNGSHPMSSGPKWSCTAA